MKLLHADRQRRRTGLENIRRLDLVDLSVAHGWDIFPSRSLRDRLLAQARRLVTRNRVSLTQSLPLYYRDKIQHVPGVQAITVSAVVRRDL